MAKAPEHKNDKTEHRSDKKGRGDEDAESASLDGGNDKNRRAAPGVVAPSSRVNVAFPFSQIRLEEPSKELAELAALVLDLVVAMGEWVPEDRLEELQQRAQAVRDSLR
jgi:hypothetical protein